MEPDWSLLLPIREYTIGWICALSLEQTACAAVLDRIHSYNGHPNLPPSENTIYILGNIGCHNIVIGTLPKGLYGNTRAAVVAARLTSSFCSIDFLFMVGIGGGIPNLAAGVDIRLGDVVVSVPDGKHSGVVKWDMGKTEKGNIFNRTGALNRPPEKLLNAVNNLQLRYNLHDSQIPKYIAQVHKSYPKLRGFCYLGEENDNLYRADYDHEDEGSMKCENCDKRKIVPRESRGHRDPLIHYGIIASGDQVIKNATTRDELRDQLKAKCVEMEGAGTLDAFPSLIVRGICDYSDSHKNKDWQPYAALTAAAYTKELLSLLLQTQTATNFQYALDSPSIYGSSHMGTPQSERGFNFTPPLDAPTTTTGAVSRGHPFWSRVDSSRSSSIAGRVPKRETDMNSRPPIPHRVNSNNSSSSDPAEISAGSSQVPAPVTSRMAAPKPTSALTSQPKKYSIAAITWGSWSYRLYFQSKEGIFEAKREKTTWQITKLADIDASPSTPLAVVTRRQGKDIRLYYLTANNIVQERRFTEAKGWIAGNLDMLQVRAAPNSRLAAVEWAGHIRVYYQGNNCDRIEELCYIDSSTERGVGNMGGWQKGASLRTALSGTEIAAARYTGDSTCVHLFYQDEKLNLKELVHKVGGNGYQDGTFVPMLAPPHASITACALFVNSSQVMLYCRSMEGKMQEFLGSETGRWVRSTVGKMLVTNNETAFSVVTAAGSFRTSRRNLFIYKDEGEIWEECWVSDVSGWFASRQVKIQE